MGGHRGPICSVVRRAPLDIHVLPRALRDDGGVDVVPALQLSHRVGKPRPIISVLGRLDPLEMVVELSACVPCADPYRETAAGEGRPRLSYRTFAPSILRYIETRAICWPSWAARQDLSPGARQIVTQRSRDSTPSAGAFFGNGSVAAALV
jgi:hypothetical protein